MDAVRHGCGWAVSSGGVNAGEVLREPEVPASREVVEAALATIRSKLKRVPTKYAKEPVEEKPKVPMLDDVGHGSTCTCESCWLGRMQKVFPGARIVGPVKSMPGFVNVAYQKPKAAPQASAEKANVPVEQSAEPPASPAVAAPESRLERLKRMFPV